MSQRSEVPSIEPWELEAYAEGYTLPHVAAYVHENPDAWAAWLHSYRQSQRTYAALYRADCPPADSLRALYWGELAPDQVQRLQAHLDECPACSAEWRSLVEALEDEVGELLNRQQEAPGLPLREQVRSLGEQFKSIIAQLVSPPSPGLALAGLRGEGGSPVDGPRQLFYQAEEIDISLSAQDEEGDLVTLVGQVLSPDDVSGAKVKVGEAGSGGQHETLLNRFGVFRLEGLQRGSVRIVFLLPQQTVIITEADL